MVLIDSLFRKRWKWGALGACNPRNHLAAADHQNSFCRLLLSKNPPPLKILHRCHARVWTLAFPTIHVEEPSVTKSGRRAFGVIKSHRQTSGVGLVPWCKRTQGVALLPREAAAGITILEAESKASIISNTQGSWSWMWQPPEQQQLQPLFLRDRV